VQQSTTVFTGSLVPPTCYCECFISACWVQSSLIRTLFFPRVSSPSLFGPASGDNAGQKFVHLCLPKLLGWSTWGHRRCKMQSRLFFDRRPREQPGCCRPANWGPLAPPRWTVFCQYSFPKVARMSPTAPLGPTRGKRWTETWRAAHRGKCCFR